MAYKINKECIQCGDCAHICPAKAIENCVVDPEKCISCGVCAAICPMGAIRKEA